MQAAGQPHNASQASVRSEEGRAHSFHLPLPAPVQPKQVLQWIRHALSPCSWCGRAIGERAVSGVDEAYCSPECAQAAGLPGRFLG
jgi:hypothetical protein